MQSVIKIGSRESQLAVRQAEIIRDQIISCDPGITVEIITMKTTGDKILDKSLEKIGGKGLFVKELDRALMDGRIDIAVFQEFLAPLFYLTCCSTSVCDSSLH